MPLIPQSTATHALSTYCVPVLLGACLLLSGCGLNHGQGGTVLVEDDLERRVPVPSPVARVVTLAPNVTEIVFAAGAGAKVVGVSMADNYPPAVNTLPRFNALPVDFEAIAALRPDLVLASDQVNSPQDATTLAAIDVPVYFVGIRTLDDVLRSIRTIGRLLGTSAQANRASDSLGTSLEALRARTSAVKHRPTTLFLVSDATLYSFGKGSYMHSMIALAGGKSITAHHEVTAPILTDEFVLVRKPEVIVGAFGPGYDPRTILQHHATWDILPAIENGQVHGVHGDLFLRPGPRLIAGAWQMATLLHPDLVAPQ